MDDAPFDLLVEHRNHLQQILDERKAVYRPDLVQEELDYLNQRIASILIARVEKRAA